MSERTTKANDIVDTYWKWSAAAGLIPVPLLDVAAVTGIQLKMIADLAKLYDVPFKADRVKSIIGSLVGALAAPASAATTVGVLGPLLKAMPGVGTVVGVLVMPAANAAVTFALGRVFTVHFESGGSLLDLDPDKMRAHFQKEFEAGRSR